MEFNITRFMHLLGRDFLLHRKRLFLALIVLVAMLFLLIVAGHHLVDPYEGGGLQVLYTAFVLLLLLGGALLTSSNLGDLRSGPERTNYLSLPASTFEKVFSKWLYTLPLFAGVLTLICWSFHKGYLWYATELSQHAIYIAERMETKMAFYFIQLYVFGHAVAFFFSFLFNKYTAVKGASISLGVFIGIGIIWALSNMGEGKGFEHTFGDAIWQLMVYVGERPTQFMLVAPVFWILAYWVFKRKTV